MECFHERRGSDGQVTVARGQRRLPLEAEGQVWRWVSGEEESIKGMNNVCRLSTLIVQVLSFIFNRKDDFNSISEE